MKDIIRTLLAAEAEAKGLTEKAGYEAEGIRRNSTAKAAEYRQGKLKEAETRVRIIHEVAENKAKEHISKIVRNTQWEIAAMDKKYQEKRERIIGTALGSVLPKI